jgi:hypothetical protein
MTRLAAKRNSSSKFNRPLPGVAVVVVVIWLERERERRGEEEKRRRGEVSFSYPILSYHQWQMAVMLYDMHVHNLTINHSSI